MTQRESVFALIRRATTKCQGGCVVVLASWAGVWCARRAGLLLFNQCGRRVVDFARRRRLGKPGAHHKRRSPNPLAGRRARSGSSNNNNNDNDDDNNNNIRRSA